jgi:TatA/E family protein of Tat protein translocase
MLGLGFTEILVILALVLILFGPDELPKMAKSLGKGLRELRKAGDDLKSTLEQEVAKIEEEPVRKPEPVPEPPPALPPPPDDPAAARAAARFAAAGIEPPNTAPATEAPKVEEVPQVKLLPPEGSVPREPAEQKQSGGESP